MNTWLSVHDDIRWFFLRDAACVFLGSPQSFLTYNSAVRLLTSRHPHSEAPQLAVNLLSILERLTTFPTKASELNAWWVEELGSKPSFSRKPVDECDNEDDVSEEPAGGREEEEEDWRKYFDEPVVMTTRSDKKPSAARMHTLTLHQSLHSLAAHRAVFTKAWLALLPRLSLGSIQTTRASSLRVLNVLHRGVVPHLTRPILIMDWVSSAVDHGEYQIPHSINHDDEILVLGGTIGLLALNALFMLMKEYNLCVSNPSPPIIASINTSTI